MSAELFFMKTSRIIDSNGIADGATLTFYDTGTLTKRSVYTTDALNVAHPNPLTVASGAAVPNIYLDSQYTYRCIVRDDDGNTIDDIDPYLGLSGGGILFVQSGADAVTRDVQSKLREVAVSVTDFGAVSSTTIDNTAAFEAALAALGANGGTIEVPLGTYRINLVIDQSNVRLRGQGGSAEYDTYPPCLRPYATGAGTTTLKIGNQTGLRYRNKLENLLISGDRGDGTMADKALWLAGGCVFFAAQDIDIRDGLHSLHIEPGGTWPATIIKLDRTFIRNDLNLATARSIYVRKYADATGYVTDLHINMSKVNKTGAGYWLEVNGTDSTGLVVHFGATYVDHTAGLGILTSASGLETIECFGGLQLDPGAAGSVIMKRGDLVKDPTRYLRGFIEGVGGQKIEFSDASQITLPGEPGAISYQPLFRSPWIIGPQYWSNALSPYDTTVPFQDAAGPNGPILWYQSGDGLETANGARIIRGHISEEITLSTSGATTDSTANLLPANSNILAVVARVTTTITTATDWELGDPTTAARFSAPNAVMAAGTTQVGTKQLYGGSAAAGPAQVAAAKVRITTTGTPGAGKIRVTVFYEQFVAPTS